jgi:hypothetical protein
MRKGPSVRKELGYTLLEICLALVIIAVMIGATLPMTHGVVAEERLRGLANDMSELASTARKLSVREGRPYAVILLDDRVSLGPWAGREAGLEETIAVRLPGPSSVMMRRDSGEKWSRRHTWIFQAGGLSEPLQMKLRDGAAWSVRVFSPLTAISREEESHFP